MKTIALSVGMLIAGILALTVLWVLIPQSRTHRFQDGSVGLALDVNINRPYQRDPFACDYETHGGWKLVNVKPDKGDGFVLREGRILIVNGTATKMTLLFQGSGGRWPVTLGLWRKDEVTP